MSRGFFPGSVLVSKPPPSRLPKCGACGLHKHCKSPKMSVSGDGERGIFVLGEGPGEAEDEQGVQFVGPSGQYLRRVLDRFGVDLDRDCWKSNAIICRPSSPLKGSSRMVLSNRNPTENEVEFCRPNLIRAIEELKPKVILCFGAFAVKSLIGHIWREDTGPIGRWHGWDIPCQKLNAWICPSYHPAYCLREDNVVLDRMFENVIEQAVSHHDRPWADVPDERSAVEVIRDCDKAASILRQMRERGGAIAFDYETDRLKPDSPDASIISCSVCWRNKRTIAYPWHGAAVAATRELLRSPCPKIASNLKFEERWTRAVLKTRVRNWAWDTMIAGHIIDNRKWITSIKFQSFVLLGSDIWDDHINRFMESKTEEDQTNQLLEQVDMNDLLLYNGLDSLLEYRVALKQMDLLNYPKPKGM